MQVDAKVRDKYFSASNESNLSYKIKFYPKKAWQYSKNFDLNLIRSINSVPLKKKNMPKFSSLSLFLENTIT